MAQITEEAIINAIAAQERSIDGIKNSYNFAENPDNLSSGVLPAILHYIPQVDIEEKAHHNVWRNDFQPQSIVFVAPRQGMGGKLKFLENSAIRYMMLYRQKFQTSGIVSGLLGTKPGLTKFFLSRLQYGAMPQLIMNDIQYIGIVATWTVLEIN